MKAFFLYIFLFISLLRGQVIPFTVGEILEYDVEFNLVPVGHAILAVDEMDTLNGVSVYHVSFTAKTGWVGDQFFIIRDRIDIWLDEAHLITHKLKKKIREGGYKRRSETVMDYNNNIAVSERDTVNILGPVRDPYSMFYYLRMIPLVEDKPMSFMTYENNKSTQFNLIVKGKEIIHAPLGSFVCTVIKPFKKGKSLFKNQGDMKIWFSDDKKKFPVKIQIKLKYGSMTLMLKKISEGMIKSN